MCRRFVVAVLVVLSAGMAALPQEAEPPSPLLGMLAHVPREAAASLSGWATVRYVDYAALFASEGMEPLRALGDLGLLVSVAPLGGMVGRIMAGPEALNYLYVSAGQMVDAVGFEWLLHVDRSLEFGEPPNPGLLLEGDFDAQAVGGALQQRGFASSEVHEVTVWHRLEDLAISLRDRNIADPFGGHLGAAARIAMLPDKLANARSWPVIESIIASAQSAKPSLADVDGYRALGEVITAPAGLLIQALFFDGQALRSTGGVSAQESEPRLGDGTSDVLPPYDLVVLADRQQGDDQVHLIGLACADAATALVAAEVLAQRIQSFRPPGGPDEPLVEYFGAAVDRSVIEFPEEGMAVALVEARYPLPTPRTDPETGTYATGGMLYRDWIRAIMRREFTPLW